MCCQSLMGLEHFISMLLTFNFVFGLDQPNWTQPNPFPSPKQSQSPFPKFHSRKWTCMQWNQKVPFYTKPNHCSSISRQRDVFSCSPSFFYSSYLSKHEWKEVCMWDLRTSSSSSSLPSSFLRTHFPNLLHQQGFSQPRFLASKQARRTVHVGLKS